jgi:hypothetical protein
MKKYFVLLLAFFLVPSLSFAYQFSKDLKKGMTDPSVKYLQTVLNADIDTQISSSGAGSPGNETTYFGSLTEMAVVKFQKKYGIEPSVGYVGSKTRAKLNSLAINTGPDGENDSNVSTTTMSIKVNGMDSVSIFSGNSVTVSWYANNLNGCILNDGQSISQVATSGSFVANFITKNRLFKLSCLGGGDKTFNSSASISVAGLNIDNTGMNQLDQPVPNNNISTDSSLFIGSSSPVYRSYNYNYYSTAPSSSLSYSSSTSSDLASSSMLFDTSTSTLATTTPFDLSSLYGTTTMATTSLGEVNINAGFVSTEPSSCWGPSSNQAVIIFSTIDNKYERYIWVQGTSKLVDNTGGIFLGNLVNKDDSSTSTKGKNNSFSPPGGALTSSMYINFVIGDDQDCNVYGKNPSISTAYMTGQGRDYVRNQEQNNSSSGSSL